MELFGEDGMELIEEGGMQIVEEGGRGGAACRKRRRMRRVGWKGRKGSGRQPTPPQCLGEEGSVGWAPSGGSNSRPHIESGGGGLEEGVNCLEVQEGLHAEKGGDGSQVQRRVGACNRRPRSGSGRKGWRCWGASRRGPRSRPRWTCLRVRRSCISGRSRPLALPSPSLPSPRPSASRSASSASDGPGLRGRSPTPCVCQRLRVTWDGLSVGACSLTGRPNG